MVFAWNVTGRGFIEDGRLLSCHRCSQFGVEHEFLIELASRKSLGPVYLSLLSLLSLLFVVVVVVVVVGILVTTGEERPIDHEPCGRFP